MQIFSTTVQFSNYSCILLYSSAVCEICEDFFSVKVQHDRLILRVCPQREVTERITLLNKNIAVNPERVQELVEKGGLKPDTQRKKPRPLRTLVFSWLQTTTLDEALANPGLEGFLMVFCEIKEVELLKFPSSL